MRKFGLSKTIDKKYRYIVLGLFFASTVLFYREFNDMQIACFMFGIMLYVYIWKIKNMAMHYGVCTDEEGIWFEWQDRALEMVKWSDVEDMDFVKSKNQSYIELYNKAGDRIFRINEKVEDYSKLLELIKTNIQDDLSPNQTPENQKENLHEKTTAKTENQTLFSSDAFYKELFQLYDQIGISLALGFAISSVVSFKPLAIAIVFGVYFLMYFFIVKWRGAKRVQILGDRLVLWFAFGKKELLFKDIKSVDEFAINMEVDVKNIMTRIITKKDKYYTFYNFSPNAKTIVKQIKKAMTSEHR